MKIHAMILLFGAWLFFSPPEVQADTFKLNDESPKTQSASDIEFIAQFELAKKENRLLSIEPILVKLPEPSGQLHGPFDPKAEAELARNINANVEHLRRIGILPASSAKDAQGSSPIFGFPLRKRPAWGSGSFYDCCNFVDQINGAGLQDYACGTRTYDGHSGIDFGIFPFPWKTMDSNQIEVVAAADGAIIEKVDGNFDRSCTAEGQPANLIVLAHPGTDRRTYYIHMKSGSLTTKSVGANVAAGEYLGLIGSSGSSTAPHLHFEVRTEPNMVDPFGTVIEPFAGVCNAAGNPSEWISQEPYLNPRLNKLTISLLNPQFSDPCPSPNPVAEATNEQYIIPADTTINPKHTLFLNDLKAGQKYVFRVRKANGEEVFWQHPHVLIGPVQADAHGNGALVWEVSNDRYLGVWEWTASLVSDQNVVLQSLSVQYRFVPWLFADGFEGNNP